MSRKRKRRDRQILFVLDGPTSVALIRQRLADRQSWTFIVINFHGLDLVERLERRHYSGKASRDFDMLGLPFVPGLGIVGIALARKRRLPVRELARLLDRMGMAHEAETLSKYGNDVIVLAPSAEVAEQAQVWLMQLVRGGPVEAS